MAVYVCAVCDTVYDEDKEGVKWDDLPNDWLCPVCDSPKSMFKRVAGSGPETEADSTASVSDDADATVEKTVWSTSLHNPDFSRYAENCGALGIRVTGKNELTAALKRLFSHDGPAMLEILTDSELI